MNQPDARARHGAWLLILGLILIHTSTAGTAYPTAGSQPEGSTAQDRTDYRPALAVPESMQPFLKHLEPGNDAFPMEGQAQQIEARLRELSVAFRTGGPATADITKALLDPSFRGARLLPVEGTAPARAALQSDTSEGVAA